MSKLLNLGYDTETVYRKHDKLREQVERIRVWITNRKDPKVHIPTTLTDAQIIPFVLACLRNDDDIKKCIHEYFYARHHGPELFTGRDTSRDDVASQMKALKYVILPNDTPDGDRIVVHRLTDGSPSAYHMEAAMKALFMTIDAALYYRGPPARGLIILFDMNLVRLAHMTRIRMGAVRKFMHYVQEALPMRLTAIHVLNTVGFMEKILALLRPLLRAEVLKMLHLHPVEMDMNEFYSKYIPKTCLPSDFGGDLESLEVLHERNWKDLTNLTAYFSAEEKQRGIIDIEFEGIPVSTHFSKLEID